MKTTRFSAAIAYFALSITWFTFSSSECVASILDLGQAANYTVFGFNGPGNTDTDVSINSSDVFGSAAVGPNSAGTAFAGQTLSVSGGSTEFTGPAFIHSPATYSSSSVNSPVAGTVTNLTQAVNDAINASASASLLAATQIFNDITSNTTIFGNGSINVIQINSGKKIELGNNEVLTLSGGANDHFIINIPDGSALKFMGGQIALSGGVTPNHVLFNVLGDSGGDVTFNSGSGANLWNGTILAPERKFQFHDSILNGALIGGNDIAITSNATVIYQPFSIAPEPGSLSLLSVGLIGLFAKIRRSRHRLTRCVPPIGA